MNDDTQFVNFDPMAMYYDVIRKTSDQMLILLRENIIRMLPKSIELKKLLEIGSGTGRISSIFASSGYHVTGIDVSQKMLDIANQKAKKDSWDFVGIKADARKLPLDDNTFDLSYSVHVLHLIKDWKKVIKECLRVTKTQCLAHIILNDKMKNEMLWIEYWKKVNELKEEENLNFKTDRESFIGIKPWKNELPKYMDSLGYKLELFEKTTDVNVPKSYLINNLGHKSTSAQRFVPDHIHEKAMSYVKQKGYFFKNKEEYLTIEEKLLIQMYFKN